MEPAEAEPDTAREADGWGTGSSIKFLKGNVGVVLRVIGGWEYVLEIQLAY